MNLRLKPFLLQTFRQKITRIQILVFLFEGGCDVIYDDIFLSFWCASVLACPIDVFFDFILFANETSN